MKNLKKENETLKQDLKQRKEKEELDNIPVNFPSDLLSNEQKRILLTWDVRQHPQLIYKGSRDGFSASTFHQKCDNKGSTIVIIKSTNGYLFGGLAHPSWNSTCSYLPDPSNRSFIFTLTNPNNIPPTKYPCITSTNAIQGHPSYGPLFGGGADINVNNNCNSTSSNSTGFGYYQDTTGKGSDTFTGAANFSVQDIEVFTI